MVPGVGGTYYLILIPATSADDITLCTRVLTQ